MTKYKDFVKEQVAASARVKEAFLADENALGQVSEVAALLVKTYRAGNKTLWAGNGGSAADAQHMAAELVNKFRLCRSGLPALALTVDTSILTAIGNDYGYGEVFYRQIIACGSAGDVFVGLSTSGNSANLVRALEACRAKGIVSVALVGSAPCRMDACVDLDDYRQTASLRCHHLGHDRHCSAVLNDTWPPLSVTKPL